MTNKLRDELAKVIAARHGADPDKMIYESLGAANAGIQCQLWETYTSQAQAVIDHLTPMMKEVVWAADAVVKRWDSPVWSDAKHTADYIHALRKALASLPACWRENGGA
jgi:hypothetical protein